ncbi:Ig-like domain-containing protein, partial [Streptomyces goshikiensis]
QTVGVGMPVSITFNKPIKDKKAVQAAINVSSSSGQEVVGHWFGEQRLDFRPEEYWKANSTVTLKLALQGVQGAPGIAGVQNKTVNFKIGRSQVSTVDAKTKKMTVTRDGAVLKTIPISAGSPANPTYNGQMVISEKFKETRMNGATVGFTDGDGKGEYDIKDVPHAMRLSNSGTFIHGNYWGPDSVFGSANTSHGCVGLNDKQGANDPGQPAAWFFDNSLIGDVVTVVNSPDKTIKPENGLNGWNMSWADWKAGSAA